MTDRNDWTVLHHLAYVYAAIASSDGAISSEELEVFCKNLHEWIPDEDPEDLMEKVMAAVAALGEDKEHKELGHLYRSIGVVAEKLDDEARTAALDDLLAIAAADGVFDPGEGALLLRIRQAWGTDPAVRRADRKLER
jgi:tellurite resistance protein